MIIRSISIKKFRGFENTKFELGTNLTVVSGQNGTQKTTLLGMLSQPFSISNKSNPLFGEKPLCGGSYKSAFAEKFKLSEKHDIAKSHEWTLHLNDKEHSKFTLESILRRKNESGQIRFWKKGTRSKGSGYIRLPVIYLSLSRLLPIGEDVSIKASNDVALTDEENSFFEKWHKKILCMPDLRLTGTDYLASSQKNTLGANTDLYDWKMNSAGQDNIGKILLAILSFRRLLQKHGNDYKGGILAIDELDATLYPASQMKLIEALRKFASKFKIQIIFTTHSLSILKQACELQFDNKLASQCRVVYLEKVDSKIVAVEGLPYDRIRNKLNIVLGLTKKSDRLPVFVEDKEGEIFLKVILKRRTSSISFNDCTLGCDHLIELASKKIPGFVFPSSLIVLDGDVRPNKRKLEKIGKLKNILLLPGENSPERIIAEFLFNLSDKSRVWDTMDLEYTKQFVFRDLSYEEIMDDRVKAKTWFNTQKQHWGRNCSKVFNPWIKLNKLKVDQFIKDFDEVSYKCLQALN